MSVERRENVQVVGDGNYERQQRVVEYAPSTQSVFVSRLSMFLWLVTGVVTALIAFRFVLKLIAANPASGFANLIYSITDFLIAPFTAIINSPVYEGGSIIDVPSIFAIIVYSLIAFVVIRLFRILFSDTGGQRSVKTVERSR